jgi:enediyne biosynthesis protein E4
VRILQRRGAVWTWLNPEVRSGEAVLRLSRWTGRWSALASGDIDGDGRPDLVLGNWGLNTASRPTLQRPVRIHYGDLDESGTVEMVEAAFDAELAREAPDRDLVTFQQAVPALVARFATHAEYAQVGVLELLGDFRPRARVVDAVTMESCVLLNRADVWERVPLPDAVQETPAMGAAVADFEGDGDEDVFLAQNFFAVQPFSLRQDAGLGRLVVNDGKGRFEPVSPAGAGIAVFGESRSAAVADFDQDGRPDLVVSQNGAATRLFRNARARPGLRVTLKGPPTNPEGIGARLRLHQGAWSGPVREVQSGSGGLSQNSVRVVLSRAPGVAGAQASALLEVTWPGGRSVKVPVEPAQESVLVSAP